MRISDWSSDVCSSDLGLAAASGHWERPREGAAVGNSHPPSPETSPERRIAFGSRVAITEPCEAVCSRGLSAASPSPDIPSDHATTAPPPNAPPAARRAALHAPLSTPPTPPPPRPPPPPPPPPPTPPP